MKKLLEVKNLHISFHTSVGDVKAVRGIDFDLYEGETLAIVGESGSGKSVAIKSIMRLLPSPPSKIVDGEILYAGKNIVEMNEKQMQQIRGNEISMIFQDPMTSLNPTMKIGKQIIEGLLRQKRCSKQEAYDKAISWMEMVGITDPKIRFDQYPHQLSGGIRQRVVIATALVNNPKILLADEPTTALDTTIQAQILDKMKEIQAETNASVIFITHDLGVVANVADRVAVMYAGQIVEVGTADEIFYDPRHPYTWGLLASMPNVDTDTQTELLSIPGTPPDLLNPPKGCAFAARNKWALAIDYEEEPPYFQISPTHFAKTWTLHKNAPKIEVPEIIASMQRKMENNFPEPIQVKGLR